jgi:beta-alanine--pyruvate transaminase
MSTDAALDAYLMPFTASRQFKQRPRLIKGAEGMYYKDVNGDPILDSSAGLWCCNAGHCRKPIVQAIQEQAANLDFAPSFQFGHPKVFELASRLADDVFPVGLGSVFFTNSGSEAVDSALKIALAYWRVKGQGSKIRLIGRERAYHGVGFGGISVGGMTKNRLWFGNMLPMVDHLPHTHDAGINTFTKDEPENGGEQFADALEGLVALHDASTIAAVIIEPVAGSTGVLPPPKGYLKRLREICTRHDILLIFDEVITAFGRLGAPCAAKKFDVVPDMITFAKGVTSGTVPMGGVAVREEISRDLVNSAPEDQIDLFHGYTYSGHPIAAAAALATLDVYHSEGLLDKVSGAYQKHWHEAVHSLRDHSLVKDIRTIGMMAGVDIAPVPGNPTKRAFEMMLHGFHEEKMMVRTTGDTIALSPPLIATEDDISMIVERIRRTLDAVATI